MNYDAIHESLARHNLNLSRKDVEFTLKVEPEMESIEDSWADDPAAAEYVRQKAEETEWGWCMVTVTARYESFTGSMSLGMCCYDSEEDFRADYYETLCDDAFWDLVSNIVTAADAIESMRNKG